MGRSTLNTTGEGKPVTGKGHGTAALGPSDSSDSGSDIVGGPGLNRDDGLPLDHGNTSDPDVDAAPTTAGPDIGDAALESGRARTATRRPRPARRPSPEPFHVRHGFDGTWPRPRHIGHGRLAAKPPWPKGMIPRPAPPGHVRPVPTGPPAVPRA